MSVVCLCVSDLHLRHTRPPARAAEPDWYKAMLRPLEQLRSLKEEFKCPIICGGDVFDNWNSNPELIKFAIKNLPKMTAVPGQHDLPYHVYTSMYRSAYGVLEEIDLLWGGSDETVYLDNDDRRVRICKFPWGFQVTAPPTDPDELKIALTHAMVWTTGHAYLNAPPTSNLRNWRKKLEGYDVAVFGDNHSGFVSKSSGCTIVNCGCLIRCKSIERNYKPFVSAIHDSGVVTRTFLDTREDKWVDPVEEAVDTKVEELRDFLTELQGISADSLEFREIMNRYLSDNDVRSSVKNILIATLEEACDD